jgi:putative spermidine/putrescine transport system permease protein
MHRSDLPAVATNPDSARGSATRLPDWAWVRSFAMCSPALLLYFVMFCVPLLMVFVLSFREFDMATGQIQDGITLARYVEVATDPYFGEVFLRTIGISLLVTAVSVVLGTPEAYILNRMRAPWRSIFLLIVLGPLLVSVVVRTLGWAILLGNNGLLNQALMFLGIAQNPMKIMYTDGAIVLGLIHICVPLVVISVWTSLQKHDSATERAAISLGASQYTVFSKIVVPQIMPGILSGALVAFSLAASAFATPALLGGRSVKVVSTAVSDEFLGTLDWPLGAALAVLLLFVNMLIATLWNRVIQGRFKEAFK